MAEKRISDIAEELSKEELTRLAEILNTHDFGEKNIRRSSLEALDATKLTRLLRNHYGANAEKVLKKVLPCIPREDLVIKLSEEKGNGKRKSENQNDEQDGSPAKHPKRIEQPSLGKFTLSDLENYATVNQSHLIKQLEEQLEPQTMEELKNQLALRKLNKTFSFTAPKAYELYINKEVKTFLTEVSSNRKSKKVPKKILDILFSAGKTALTAELEEDLSGDIESNFPSPAEHTPPDNPEDTNEKTHDAEVKAENSCSTTTGSAGDHRPQVTHLCKTNGAEDQSRENEPVFPSPAECQPPVNPDANEKTDDAKSKEENSSCSTVAASPGGDRRSQLTPSCETYKKTKDTKVPKAKVKNGPCEKLVAPFKKWYNKAKKYHGESFSFDHTGVREHETYSCFIALDILRITSPEEIILRFLEDKKDLTCGKQLKKNVEFELQFNMAVLGIQRSEIISLDSDFFQEVKAGTHYFTQFEFFFKEVVSKVVLHLLALHKQAKLDILWKGLEC